MPKTKKKNFPTKQKKPKKAKNKAIITKQKLLLCDSIKTYLEFNHLF